MNKRLESSIQIENFMESGRDIEVSDFGFRSTFNEGSVLIAIFNLFYRGCIETESAQTTDSLPQLKIFEFSRRVDSKKHNLFPLFAWSFFVFSQCRPVFEASRGLQGLPLTMKLGSLCRVNFGKFQFDCT